MPCEKRQLMSLHHDFAPWEKHYDEFVLQGCSSLALLLAGQNTSCWLFL